MVRKASGLFESRSRQIACFVVCLMLMSVVAIMRDSRLFGIHIPRPGDETELQVPILTIAENGDEIINTTELGKDIVGYVGPTPVEITVHDGRILNVNPLKNRETPEFYGAVRNSDMLDSWNGLTLQEASRVTPDAVSGATYTSSALIRNAQAGINYALSEPVKPSSDSGLKLDFKFFFVIAVILAAAILPLFVKGRMYRNFQLVVNVVILGFWGGTYICYMRMVSLTANGVVSWALIPVMLMIVTAFFYPFFGKKNYYCTWICPYGSFQDLAGQLGGWLAARGWWRQVTVSARTARYLGWTRDVLWAVLMWLMMSGLWFDWMDWEPFAAFYFREVSVVALSIAGGFLLLSLFIRRPYCRFVCPTGTLFKISEANH